MNTYEFNEMMGIIVGLILVLGSLAVIIGATFICMDKGDCSRVNDIGMGGLLGMFLIIGLAILTGTIKLRPDPKLLREDE